MECQTVDWNSQGFSAPLRNWSTARKSCSWILRNVMVVLLMLGALSACAAAKPDSAAQAQIRAKDRKDVQDYLQALDSTEPKLFLSREDLERSKAVSRLKCFPDNLLDEAKGINGNSPLRFLGSFALALPTAKSSGNALAEATASTSLLEGYLPLPFRTEHAKPSSADSFAYEYEHTLCAIRLSSSFSVEGVADSLEADDRLRRSMTLPEGGVLNLQLSRFLFGAIQPAPATMAGQLVAGGSVEQVSLDQATSPNDVNYVGTFFVAVRAAGAIPILNGASDANAARSLWGGVEAYWRTVPQSIRDELRCDRQIRGFVARVAFPVADRLAIRLTFQDANGVHLESSKKFSIQLQLTNLDKKQTPLRRLL